MIQKFVEKYNLPIAIILLICILVQSALSAYANSATFDEPNYIALGNLALTRSNFEISPGNPPLMKYIVGLPSAALGLKTDENAAFGFLEKDSAEYKLLFRSKIEPRILLFLSRFPVIILSILLGILVFLWARKLYGKTAGLFSLALYAFEPTILANSSLATLDLGTTFFLILSLAAFYKYLDDKKAKYLILAGIISGLAICAKATGLHLFPLFAIMFIFEFFNSKKGVGKKIPLLITAIKKMVWPLALITMVAGVVILAAYQFQYGPIYPKGIDRHIDGGFLMDASNPAGVFIKNFIEKTPVPFNFYIRDLALQYLRQKEPQSNYLLGEIYPEGNWLYYIVALGSKLTIPFILLLLIAIYSIRRKPISEKEWRLVIPALFWLAYFSLMVSVNIGIRYILPFYPLAIIFIGRLIDDKSGRKEKAIAKANFAKIIMLFLLAWHISESLLISPNYIPYFNQLAGGPNNGHAILSDSNLDIGQANYQLKDYLDQNGIEKIKYSYAGSVPPEYYGINHELMPSGFGRGEEDCTPQKGLIAVSATNLNGDYFKNHDCYKWLRELKPDAIVANVIFIYDIK